MRRVWKNRDVATPLFTWSECYRKYMYIPLYIVSYMWRRIGQQSDELECQGRAACCQLLFHPETDGRRERERDAT